MILLKSIYKIIFSDFIANKIPQVHLTVLLNIYILKRKKEQLNTVAGSRQWNCSVWKEVLSWLRIEGYLKNTIVTPLVRASFLCEESKPIERDEQNEKTKNGSICYPFLVFLFWALKCGIISYALVGTIALRVLKILRIKNPNPKKGFIGATVALLLF